MNFFGTFLTRKNVEAEPWYKIKKIGRRIVAYKISDSLMVILRFQNNLEIF
jgi:hypothetical protein